ncbi:MAG: flavin oxidoreductase/NADH oxidase [Clostridia bacterium]|nr:flavin oxidoreductase/NADH oxidase [Clostridia bacterium]
MIRKVYSSLDEFKEQNTGLGTNLPHSDDTGVLSQGIKIGDKEASNRLVCQPMEGCDGERTGEPGELTHRRYERFARGGAGLIWFEATAVLEEGRANPRQLYITKSNLDAFKREVEFIKNTGLKENGYEPLVIMQATHSGRYSKPNGTPAPLIAYNNPIFEAQNPIPKDRIVSDEYLDRVGEALIGGAVLAEQAGFDGVDIKCCHRYLNSELLSAFNRDGRYGGSLENRTRLLRESVKGAIESCNRGFTVTSRLNVYDGFPYPYGFGVAKDSSLDVDLTEPVQLINELYGYGVRLLNVTMGNPYFNPHVNRPFAHGGYTPDEHPLSGVKRVLDTTAKIKESVPDMNIICSATSYLGAASPNVVSAYIQDKKFDMAGFGRMTFAYPDFANDIIKNGSLDAKKCCICCSKCTETMRAGGTPGCVIRDREVYLPIYKKYCTEEK